MLLWITILFLFFLFYKLFSNQNLNLDKLKICDQVKVQKLNPGLILLKSVISKEDQIKLCRYAKSIGEGKETKHSFFVNFNGKKTLNLGKIFQ